MKKDPSQDGMHESMVYVTPKIQTFSPQELLDLLGPAQGYGGDPGPVGAPGPTYRTLPGMRD